MNEQDLSYCSDVGGDLSNFREVFLQSQALEGITMSMVSSDLSVYFMITLLITFW